MVVKANGRRKPKKKKVEGVLGWGLLDLIPPTGGSRRRRHEGGSNSPLPLPSKERGLGETKGFPQIEAQAPSQAAWQSWLRWSKARQTKPNGSARYNQRNLPNVQRAREDKRRNIFESKKHLMPVLSCRQPPRNMVAIKYSRQAVSSKHILGGQKNK